MGRTVYLPTWKVDFYGFHVGKYTSPMDDMGTGWLIGILIIFIMVYYNPYIPG